MSSEGGITSVEHSGFTVTSNSGATPEQLAESLNVGREPEDQPDKPDISKAASEMGKKGGEAAAKAKAKAAREAKKEAKAADKEPEESREVSEPEAAVDEPAEPAEAAPDPKKGNPRHDPTARVAEATRKAKEAHERAERAEREAAETRYRLEMLERERQAPSQRQEPAEQRQAPQGKPQAGDYEDYEEYLDARDAWNRNKWTQETAVRFSAHQAATAHVQKVTQTADAFKAALTKAATTDPEFREKLDPDLMQLRPSFDLTPDERPNSLNWLADDLLSAPDLAPGLLLYLSEHPDERQRIVALSSPRAITRELTRIAVRLDAATTGPSSERRVSKASPPPTPVGGSPAVASGTGYKPGMSLDEFARRWKP